MGDDVDISTLTMEQYLALIQDNIRPGIVKPKIDSDVKFEIKWQLYERIKTQNFQRVFPITLSEPALRQKNRLFAGLITTWDLLEKVFIRRYYPPFKTALKLEKIRNLKQGWTRHCIMRWKGLDIPTRIRLDSKGFIPMMSPAQALKSIQVMAYHSHNWYDEATTRKSINDSLNNIDKKKLKENIHVIQVSRKIYEGVHPTNECSLIKEDKAVEQRRLKGNLYKIHEAVCMIGIPRMTHKVKTQMNNGCDIMVKDVERLKQMLSPTIQTLPNLEPVDLNNKETEFEIISTRNRMDFNKKFYNSLARAPNCCSVVRSKG
nr:hypothetical protein [Tanacetum cinerariifolium]